MRLQLINTISTLLLGGLFSLSSCTKKDYKIPTPKDTLQNDCIKRTQGPNIVGQTIEFAYAMAIIAEKGKLTNATVEASIDGAVGTWMENNSYYTNNSGVDIGIPVGSASVTSKNVTTVTFNKDTNAATLRYYYVIPEQARGQSVSFTFSAQSSDGETVSYKMGPYTIAKMDMKKGINLTDGGLMYISIADMAAYNAADAAARAGSIDLVYLYRNITTSAFNFALVSPAADPQYLPGVTLPTGVNKSTYVRKVFNLQDYNLAQMQYGIYIDDPDFQQLNMTNDPNYAINLKQEAGVWVETTDHKYRAYVYFNTASTTTKNAVVGIKRYTL
ncbi:DUF4466 domain-containing protein [Niastella koreensis]|uniref:DUF4466 domain-containing protein n=2 Tax=Niastella koreensis TaxID=354356 RepID=G8TDN6_NIAKG|nr:DUF4466 family protein [Niastella koreensis]AEW01486.1 hypothetical protein Niako_5249 [Niastella koreensis GR20-10]OQP48213.1 DUF4466 domain-containing protein [Niastella koreensis]